jgi:hypothetical protein
MRFSGTPEFLKIAQDSAVQSRLFKRRPPRVFNL